jgi:aminoglycoside phosphotransferase (APT) family kinase protein
MSRDDQLTAWYQARLDDPTATVVVTGTPEAGYSNEVLFATVTTASAMEQIVVRLPPTGPPLFPAYDLPMQVAVQEFASSAGVPVPTPLVLEQDATWLGAPFLVMPLVDGRIPGEVPATCEWLLALSPDEQRAVEVGFLDALTTLHRAAGAPAGVRDPGSLAGELDHWTEFAAFACDGVDAEPLVELFHACRALVPADEPPSSVLWGDVRLGNAIVADDGTPAAILDWEMASIGPAEMDVAWYVSQARMMARFFGSTVPGFLEPEAIVAHCSTALGRPLHDMAWHEGFAMARSAAVHHRAEVVAALSEARDLPNAADSFLITYTAKHLAKLV